MDNKGIKMTKSEIRLFSDPLITLPMFLIILLYGFPTAWFIGTTIVERYIKPGAWIVFIWGGLATIIAFYFIHVHIRAKKSKYVNLNNNNLDISQRYDIVGDNKGEKE